MTVERRNRIEAQVRREVARSFLYIANAFGECDTCHTEPQNLYREDSEEGWQECERCLVVRDTRKAVRAAERVSP